MHVVTRKELRYKNDKNYIKNSNDKEKQINMPDRTKITEETAMTRMTTMTRVTRTTGMIRMIKMTMVTEISRVTGWLG